MSIGFGIQRLIGIAVWADIETDIERGCRLG